jgi:hypothetical protein
MSPTTSTLTAVGAPGRTLPPPIDDMQETADDRKIWPALAPMLDVCAEVVEPAFRRADKAALWHQWSHRQLIKWATVFGAAAVLFAILQLAFADLIGPQTMTVAEFMAVFLAFVAVGLGLRAAFQANWMVERNKAERLRLAKFHVLIDPDLWSGKAAIQARMRADLEQHVREIEAADRDAVHYWLENDTVPDPPPNVLALTVPPPATSELVDYYRTRRLQFQLAFFRKRADENVKLDLLTKYPSPILFFGTVGAVLIHFTYDLVTDPVRLDLVSRWLIVLAASLPVVGGAFRTFRIAYEFARNTYRYRAKAVALTAIDSALEPATDPRSQFRGFWASEQILETEHREWLRLMIEAEWFA